LATVTVRIHDRTYELACEDGQEGHLKGLANELDRRVAKLAQSAGPYVGDQRLLVMAALVMLDELAERGDSKAPSLTGTNQAVVAAIESLARRIENIAARLEGT
jgi:cell division protein ZapA